MGEVNWDFAVNRWTKTVLELQANEGGEEVDDRCKNLPPEFKARIIATLRSLSEDNQD